MFSRFTISVLVLLTASCEEKRSSAPPVASMTASAPPPPSAAPVATASSAAPSGTPAPVASADGTMLTGDGKDVVLTVKDPAKTPDKSIQAAVGGSVTLFLPDYPGTTWSAEAYDKTLGKPKEEVIPGFAPGTNGHQFKWTLNGPLVKAAQKYKVQLVNKKTADKTAKPSGTFSLTIEMK